MLFIITGQEQLMMEQKLAALKKEYPIMEPELNDTRIDCRDVSCQEIINEVTSVPFFSDYRFVVLTHPYFLNTEKGRNEKSEDIDRVIEALSHTSEDMVIVIYAPGKLDERKKTVKSLRKVATNLDFPQLEPHRLKTITAQAFRKRKTEIDDDALDLLMSRAGSGLMQLQNETEKLCLYTQHVTYDDVYSLVSKPLEENAFELTSAMLKKDLNKVLSIYKDLMTQNEEPIRLIALMASSLRTLYQVKLLDRKGYNDQEIGKYLDMNPYRLKYIRNDTKNFELNDLLNLIHALSELDVQIKRGQVDKYQGLELFFMKLV